MNDLSPATTAQAPVASTPVLSAPCIFAAAEALLPHLERGQRIDSMTLRDAMETAFRASDASGFWDWKDAYEACEVATVFFLRKFGRALFRRAAAPEARLAALSKIAGLLPSHTRRSEESQALQQFSTPLPLGLAAVTAAAITPADVVLEPSAGTGLMAILAEVSGGSLALNELAETRADLLTTLFPALPVTRFDAAQIHDHLDAGVVPSVVLMNPPFSALANVTTRVADAAFRHIASALARLAPGGRLVTITGAGFGPQAPAWRDAFIRLQEQGRVVFTAAVDGAVYAKHGTTFDTRLTVIDKVPAEDSSSRANHRHLTAAMIDSRDFLAAKKIAETEMLVPPGPKVAFSGGDTTDHRTIWDRLDQIHAKHPDMVLMHGGSPKGAERIAATWASNRKVPQVAFKPDWTKHAKAAPFKRNDQMLDCLPIGVIIFPGTGIQENLADKARKMGIPVYRMAKGGA